MDCDLVSCADYKQWYMIDTLLSASANLNVQADQIEPSNCNSIKLCIIMKSDYSNFAYLTRQKK